MSDLENANHASYEINPAFLHPNGDLKGKKEKKKKEKKKQEPFRRIAPNEPDEDIAMAEIEDPYLSSDPDESSDSLVEENIIEENVERQEEAALVEFKKSIAKEMGVAFQKKEQAAQFIAHNSMDPVKPQMSRAASVTRWKMK
jgi:hypothetical protein